MPPLPLASCFPTGCRVTPVVALPLPLVLSTCRLRLATSCLHLGTCCRLLSAGTSPLVCLSFSGWLSPHILSHRCLKCSSSTPTFICTGWLLHRILLHCFRLPSSCQHHRLSTHHHLTSCRQLHLPFVSCLPGLVATLPLLWHLCLTSNSLPSPPPLPLFVSCSCLPQQVVMLPPIKL